MRDRRIIDELVRTNEELALAVRILLEQRNRPILAIASTDLNYIIMNSTLTLGIDAVTQVVLLDNATLQPNTTAVFSGLSVSSDTPSVATFAVDSVILTQIDATPVAAGSGNLIVTVTADYTDSNTGLPVTGAAFTATIPFTVVASPEGLLLSITGFVNVAPSTTSTTTSTSTTLATS